MKVLVLGDRITDFYSFCKATRLCPEGPAPVLVVEKQRTSEGGAALVGKQLQVLMGEKSVVECYGSISEKHRIFADRTILCRIDKDCQSFLPEKEYWNAIQHQGAHADAIVIGDYGKGAMKQQLGINVTNYCKENSIPLFVDAKGSPEPYAGCYALFPNENEHNGIHTRDYKNIIRKLGPRGCSVNGYVVPTAEQQVYDVTGAGDVFLAGFVYKWLSLKDNVQDNQSRCMKAAEYGNKLAGISVKHLGTYVVQLEDINR